MPRHAPAARLDVGAIADAAIGIIKPLAARLDALEKEWEREKGVGNVRWRGTYKQSEIYRSGELLTHDGGLWVALRDSAQTPGRPPEGQPAAYQLVVKNGGMR